VNSPFHQANVFSLDDVQPRILAGTDLWHSQLYVTITTSSITSARRTP
jgi:hypothetical protein